MGAHGDCCVQWTNEAPELQRVILLACMLFCAMCRGTYL